MKQGKKIFLLGVSLLLVFLAFSIYFIFIESEKQALTKQDQEQVRNTSQQFQFDLQEQVNNYLDEKSISKDKIAISLFDFSSGNEFHMNADEYFIAASVYKLPLAMYYYELIEKGSYSKNQPFLYEPIHYENGGPIGDNYAPGDEIPLQTLLQAMIVDSDNTSGHILYEKIGSWAQFKQVISTYGSREQQPIFFSLENVLNSRFTNDVLIYLYQNQEIFANLLEDMKNTTPGDYLQKRISAPVAQKFGLYGAANNSAGIVFSDKPYSIAIFTELGDNGDDVIGDLNKICFDYLHDLHD